MNAHRVGRGELAGSIEVVGCIVNADVRAGSATIMVGRSQTSTEAR